MKKIYGALASLLIAFTSVLAQDQCKPIGWASYSGTTTGGGSAAPTVVTTYDQLKAAITDASVKMVHISGTIAIPGGGRLSISGQSNKTVIGLPGSKLTSSDQSSSGSGILYVKTSSNIILRNITFQGPGAKDVDGYDNLTIEGGDHLWVDHCDFIDGLDGNFDIKRQANYVAVTWCKFSYTSKSSNHQFSNLIGHDDGFTADKGFLKVTFQYNWWADGCVERMPRVRFGQVHVVNNYFSSSKADYNIAVGVGADVRVENNFFGVSTTYVDLSKSDGNSKVTCVGNSPSVSTSKGSAFTPPYSLAIAPASSVKALVSSATCGAGATMDGPTLCGCDGNKAPTVSITSPGSNASFNAPASITINADAADPDGSIAKVDFYNGTTLIGSDASSPYSVSWTNVAAGTYTVTAKATDNKGAEATSTAITVKVTASSCSATITPSGSTTFCQGENVTLTASSGNSYVWKNGDNQVGTSKTYVATSTGSYTVEVTDANNCKATAAPVTVTVSSSATWYADTDGDGKGDPNASQVACAKPAGYVSDNTDKCPQDINKADPGLCGCGKTEGACIDCNGTVAGTAIIDNCARCVEGTTGKQACTASFQAEEACGKEGTVDSDKAGFLGTGFVNTPNATGVFVSFAINAPSDGNIQIGFRYGNTGGANRPATISINGTAIPNPVNFVINASSPTYWTYEELTVPVVAGQNFIKLIANVADGLPNLDLLYVLAAGVTSESCVVNSMEDGVSGQTTSAVFPNPFAESFTISQGGEFDYTVYNLAGVEVEKGKGIHTASCGKDLQAGFYVVKIINDQKSSFLKIEKK